MRNKYFSLQDLARALGISIGSVKVNASRYVKQGFLSLRPFQLFERKTCSAIILKFYLETSIKPYKLELSKPFFKKENTPAKILEV